MRPRLYSAQKLFVYLVFQSVYYSVTFSDYRFLRNCVIFNLPCTLNSMNMFLAMTIFLISFEFGKFQLGLKEN